MRKLLVVLPFFIIGLFIVGRISYNKLENLEMFHAASPVPSFLTLPKNNQVSTISLWFPFLSFAEESKEAPIVSAKSVLVYELTSNKVLYEKSPSVRLPMASLTKIMTAIIALENKKSDDRYSVLPEHLVGENSMGLSEGEILSLEELLYGLILRSGNDASEVLASHFPGGKSKFIEAMNKKAQAFGLTDTHFTNPSGLQGDGNQYTTAENLLVITTYALNNFPLFNNVAATFEHTIPLTNTHKEFYLQNETNLISSYPGVKGVKDGYTPEAGLCLVTYLEHEDLKIIGIILGSENRRQEMKDLLDYALLSVGKTPPKHD